MSIENEFPERGNSIASEEVPIKEAEVANGVLERIPGERIEIEALNFGKLVTERGYVTTGYAVTLKTRGIESGANLFSEKIFGFSLLPENIAQDHGALVIRSVAGGVVAQRACFRPEAGEGSSGRGYKQANSLVFDGKSFARHSSQLAQRLADFRANSDLETTPLAQRSGIAPVAMELEAHDIPGLENAEPNTQAIVTFLRSGEQKPFRISRASCPTEADFLRVVGTAVEILHVTDPDKIKDLYVISGLEEKTIEGFLAAPVQLILY